MLFTNKTKLPQRKDIMMGGEKIEWVSSFKYLGVTLQSNLSWDEHIDNITKRARFTWAQCKKMIGESMLVMDTDSMINKQRTKKLVLKAI